MVSRANQRIFACIDESKYLLMVAHLTVNPDIPQRSKPLLADEHTGTPWYSIPGEVREHRAKLKNISNAQMVQIEKFCQNCNK
jgi:hypothetical protein